MAKTIRQIKNLVDSYKNIRSNFAGLLASEDSDHRLSAQKKIKSELHYIFTWNMSTQNNKEDRFIYCGSNTGVDYKQIKATYKKIGAIFTQAIADQDFSTLLDTLNDRMNFGARICRDRSDWAELLENNFGDSFHYCEDCGVLDHTDNITWAYGGDKCICERCRDRSYHWSDYQDTYIHDDDEDYDQDNGLIGEYHSSSENLGKIPSLHDQHKNPIYLGLELEMEVNDSADRLHKAETLLNAIGRYKGNQYCLLENDGSLDHGFEMVTGYTGLDVHAEQLKFFDQPFRGMRSHDTRTCGLHIHICKTGMTMPHASKLILFINESANQRLIKAIARRENPDYAKIKNKRADYRWLKNAKQNSGIRSQLAQLNEDRYEALNFKNYNTVEFRMFKGTLKYSTIMACLEFTYASWHFARDTGINNLGIDDFLKYISQPAQLKTTKFLRGYLQEKGFSIPAPVKKNPRIATLDNVVSEEV